MGNNQNQGNTINPEHGSLMSQETTEIMIEIDVNVENVSVLQDFEIINKEDCVEEVVEVGSLENNLNNIPKEGITDRSDLSDVKANLQEDNETFDDPINTEMENLYNIPEEGIADRSDLSVVKADLQEDKETFDDLINTEMENLNNIPEEGIANRSDLYDVKADLQEDNETFDDSINTEMENLNNIPEESIADRSDLYDVKADLQKDNETFDDVINTEMTNLQDVEGMNKEDCAEEGVNVGSLENNENNKPEDDIEVVPVNAFFDNDIIPEMANDDAKAESGTILQECEYTNGPNCEEIDDKGANNIEEEPDIPEEELDIPEEESDIIQEETDIPEVQPDVHNIIDDSQSDNAYLDKSTELQFVDNDGNDERGSHLETCKTLNAKFDDEEEDGARCLEINIPKEVVMDDEECTEILIIRNKILEIFPDVEESYLLKLCYDNSKSTIEEISEILMNGYPKNPEVQKNYVAKIKEVLSINDDKLASHLASNIKSKEDLNNFVNETYETEIKEPDPFKVTSVYCGCCRNENLKIDEMIDCPNGCYFCKNCVVNNMQSKYAEGYVDMRCLRNCGAKYTIGQLQDFMNPTLFERILRLLQHSEIEEAKINDLHRCPFCDYAAVVEEAIFNCTECGKDSCILCKKESHPSLLCSQVEDDDDVRKRTFIENELSEALFRTCPNCNLKIIKEDGSNKMTCMCGNMMCYVCKASVQDYTHFNGQGGSNFNLCPLYNNTREMHAANVRQRARDVMNEVGGNLKIDPTADIDDFL